MPRGAPRARPSLEEPGPRRRIRSVGRTAGSVRDRDRGESLLFAEVVPLVRGAVQPGRHVTVETSRDVYWPVACDLMATAQSSRIPRRRRESPEWAVRHEARGTCEVVRRLLAEYDYQLKFVVQRPKTAARGGGLPGRVFRGRPRPRVAHAARRPRPWRSWPSGVGWSVLARRPGRDSVPGGRSNGSAPGGGV